jgi:hypothetical protein
MISTSLRIRRLACFLFRGSEKTYRERGSVLVNGAVLCINQVFLLVKCAFLSKLLRGRALHFTVSTLKAKVQLPNHGLEP